MMRCPESASPSPRPLRGTAPRPARDQTHDLPTCTAIAALLAAAIGCSAPPRDYGSTGSSGSTSGGGAGGGAGSGSGGGPGSQSSVASGSAETCPAAHICAVPPAEGWIGPLVAAGGMPAPDCPADYPERALDVTDKVSAAPAKCTCSCGAPTINCGPLGVVWRQGCGAPVAKDVVMAPKTCTPLTAKQAAASAVFDSTVATPCAPKPTIDMSPPIPESGARLCGGAISHQGCAGSLLCLAKPIAPFSSVCVVRSGNEPCPPGYLNKTIRYATIKDTRGCSPCQCGEPTGVACNTTFATFSDAACTMSKQAGMTGTACVAAFGAIIYDPPVSTGSCAASSVTPKGSVELADPYTVCCADPGTLEP